MNHCIYEAFVFIVGQELEDLDRVLPGAGNAREGGDGSEMRQGPVKDPVREGGLIAMRYC